jgi:hypothetical protein
MNWAKQATVAIISPLLVAWSVNPHALHGQQPSSAASSGTAGGHATTKSAQQGAGRVNTQGGSASWTAGKSSFGIAPQHGIWRDPAVPYPSALATPKPGSSPLAAPERSTELSTSSGRSAYTPGLLSPRPSMGRASASAALGSTSRGTTVAQGTARTAHVSRAGFGGKLGRPRTASGSKLSERRTVGMNRPSRGSSRTGRAPFGTARPAEQKRRVRPAIGSSLGSDLEEGQGKLGGRVQP